MADPLVEAIEKGNVDTEKLAEIGRRGLAEARKLLEGNPELARRMGFHLGGSGS